jgi:hypothetical protein
MRADVVVEATGEGVYATAVDSPGVTVMNDPEAAGALRKVAESRGRKVEGRGRQYDDKGVDIVGYLIYRQ